LYSLPKSILAQLAGPLPISHVWTKNFSLFLSSLEKMSSLETFKWKILDGARDYQVMNVLLALVKLSCLWELQINFKESSMRLSESRTWRHPICFQSPHLSRIQFQAIPGQLMDKVADVLLVCPKLRDLHLFVTGHLHISLHRLFKEATWRDLQRLHIAGHFHVNEDESHRDTVIQPRIHILADFWLRHPMLECLSFYPRRTSADTAIHPLLIPEDALPKLRSLGAMHKAIVDIGEHVAKLDYLQIIIPYYVADLPQMRASVLALLRRAASMRSLVLSCWPSHQLKKVVDAVPHLEKLKVIVLTSKNPVSLPVSSMHNLTHLSGVLVTNDPCMQGFPTYILEQLGHLPRLAYVDLYRGPYCQQTMDRFILVRNNEGELEEARMIVEGHDDEFDYNKWGNLYTSER